MSKSQGKRSFLVNVGLACSLVAGSILALWTIFYFVIYLGYGNLMVRGHQDFARNGVSQIQPALEMEELFPDCRHRITYTGESSESTWNTTAFFGNRYKLEMEVPVTIKSKDSGSMTGEPKFYFFEVDSVSILPSGQLSTKYSRNFKFHRLTAEQWKKIYDSGGDFTSIGCILKTTPVDNFDKYAASSRPSN